tara:strand:+ start:446 stop:652 length:207 start_codon:yes stop_codon:yes gene_type:complete
VVIIPARAASRALVGGEKDIVRVGRVGRVYVVFFVNGIPNYIMRNIKSIFSENHMDGALLDFLPTLQN